MSNNRIQETNVVCSSYIWKRRALAEISAFAADNDIGKFKYCTPNGASSATNNGGPNADDPRARHAAAEEAQRARQAAAKAAGVPRNAAEAAAMAEQQKADTARRTAQAAAQGAKKEDQQAGMRGESNAESETEGGIKEKSAGGDGKSPESEKAQDADKQSDPYEVMQISRDASQADIRKVYRALTLKYHPDRNPNDAMAAAKMSSINAA